MANQTTKSEPEKFRSVSLFTILPDEPLPFRIAIFFKGRHLVYRNPGQMFESHFYDKFIYRRIHKIFVPEEDFEAYLEYQKKKEQEKERTEDSKSASDQALIHKTSLGLKKITIDLFSSGTDEELEETVQEGMTVAGKAVEAILSKPYVEPFYSLTYKANSVIDHSMRVSILSTYLGYQLGFVNPIALEHLAVASLLHDIGKTRLGLDLEDVFEEDSTNKREEALLKQHPIVACDILSRNPLVPGEVARIIREHHEARDGSGYPAGIRGPKMNGLSRVFIIANTFDNLSSTADGNREQRYLAAAKEMLTNLRSKFDVNLLPRALKLLTKDLSIS